MLVAAGGNGGEALGSIDDSSWAWGGGDGGGGRVKLFGTSTFAGTTDVEGGLGGVAPATNASFAGNPGEAGSVGGSDTVPDEFLNLVCQ